MILEYIKDCVRLENGRIPTYRELQEKLKIRSLSIIKYHVGVLVKDGHLKISPIKVEVVER